MGDGKMRYGEQCIDGGWYYLTPGSGAVDYEWAYIPGKNKWVYYGPYMGDGRMRYGQQTLRGERYWFDLYTGAAEYGHYLRWMLHEAPGSGEVETFNGASLSSSTLGLLTADVTSFSSAGYDLGFIMMDISSGKGVSYNIDTPFWSASTIKAPYVTSLCRYVFGAKPVTASSDYAVIRDTTVNSSNSGYSQLRRKYGQAPFKSFIDDAATGFRDSISHYVYYSSRDLAKLWLWMYSYFCNGTCGRQCSELFSSANNSAIRLTLGSRHSVRSKAGWSWASSHPVTHDAGIVYDGNNPYLIVVMSSAPNRVDLLKNVVNHLDIAHNELV